MSEQTFEQMLNESFKTIHTGEAVEGSVIDVKPGEAILNIGYKSDGVLTRNEYTNDSSVDLTEVLHVGDKLEVKVIKVNDGDGQVLLSYKRLAADRGNKRIEEAYNNKEVLTAKVTQVLSGGLSVVVDEVRVFIPASLVSDTYEKDLNKYLGQEIEFMITEYNPNRRRYIGNRKVLLVAKRKEMQEKLFSTIQPGDVVEGTVKNITDLRKVLWLLCVKCTIFLLCIIIVYHKLLILIQTCIRHSSLFESLIKNTVFITFL